MSPPQRQGVQGGPKEPLRRLAGWDALGGALWREGEGRGLCLGSTIGRFIVDYLPYTLSGVSGATPGAG